MNSSTEIISQLFRDVFRSWFWIPLLISLYFLGKYALRSRNRLKPGHPVIAEVINIQVNPVDSEDQIVFHVNSKFVLDGQQYFSSVEGSYSIHKSNQIDRMTYKWLNENKEAKFVELTYNPKNPRESSIKQLTRQGDFLNPFEATLLSSRQFLVILAVPLFSFVLCDARDAIAGKRIEAEIQLNITQGSFSLDLEHVGYSPNKARSTVTPLESAKFTDVKNMNQKITYYLERSFYRDSNHYRITIRPEVIGSMGLKIRRDQEVICQKQISNLTMDDTQTIELECN